MPKTLVTGAAGFIGSAVVRKLLERGREVRCLIKPGENTRNLDGLEVERMAGDVTDRNGMARALEGCDTLYHLAAIYALWLPDNKLMYDVNVEGTKTTLWAAYKAGLKKVVYTSSIAAVGFRDDGRPADETVEFNAWDKSNAYVRSKWLSEREALRFAAEGLPLVAVNPAFPFGERDVGPTPTGQFVLQMLRHKLPGYPDGGFCAVDVEDVAMGHLLAEEKGRVGERYILGNHNVTWKEFVDLVAQVAGVPAPKRRLPGWVAKSLAFSMEQVANRVTHKKPLMTYKSAVYAARSLHFDNTKARAELGLPQTPIRETLERSVRWFRANGYA
jgi:dihydroflavonol-4-reductase